MDAASVDASSNTGSTYTTSSSGSSDTNGRESADDAMFPYVARRSRRPEREPAPIRDTPAMIMASHAAALSVPRARARGRGVDQTQT